MMSLQSSMHSSQMNTDGPAMSLRTSCWLLPQNEQYRSLSPEEDFSAIKRLRAVFRSTLLGYEPFLQDFVDDPVLAGLLGGEEIVALGVPRDLLHRSAGVKRHQHVEALAQAQDVLGMDLDVRRLALEAAERLVNHDIRIGHREALALGA